MKFNLVFSLTIGLFVLGTFAAPENNRSEIFDDDFPEEVYDTKIEFAEINARIRTELESVEKFIEENEDFKVETTETSEPEFEVVEKIIEPELKPEDETFEETKAESAKRVKRAGDYRRHPKSKDLKRLLPKICDWATQYAEAGSK